MMFLAFIYHNILEEFVGYVISSCTKKLEASERQRVRIWGLGMNYPQPSQASPLNHFQIIR